MIFPAGATLVLKGGTYMRGASFILLVSILSLTMPPAPAAPTDNGAEELRLTNEWSEAAAQFMTRGEYEEARKLYLRSLAVWKTQSVRNIP